MAPLAREEPFVFAAVTSERHRYILSAFFEAGMREEEARWGK
jgi:hypothetical protein